MNLLAEIDYQATAGNVDRLLKIKLPKLCYRAGRGIYELSSPQLSLAPAHSTGGNSAEASIINTLGIEQIILAIHHTIYHCGEISKTILIDTYIHHYTPDRIISLLPYERSQYFHKLKPLALNEFADRYDYWQRKCGVDIEDITDLHIYQ